MKRFYKNAVAVKGQSGFEIHLDGRAVRTPGGLILTAPAKDLASAIADEWAAQEDRIDPETMPLTQMMTTALEQVGRNRAAMTEAALDYLDTDLLCYRAAHDAVAARQAEAWDPWLSWFEREFGVPLATTDDLQALTQPEGAHHAVAKAVNGLDDQAFTVLQLVTALSGSIVLALAFVRNALSPEDAYNAANVEEIYKAKIYNAALHGEEPQQQRRNQAIRRDLEAARRFQALSGLINAV